MNNSSPQIKKDSDADGLSDDQESLMGTNPNDADTDHDSLGDYQEVNVYGTNPFNPDSDGDGIGDGDEVKRGTNPRGAGLLKDLFIPHEGNNYSPKALQPKRLLFHAASALAVKLLMIGFLLSFPIQAWLTPDILAEQSQKIINLTNALRSSLGLNALNTSNALTQASLAKAQDMLIGQYFAHVSPENKSLKSFLQIYNYKYKTAGENLALGFSAAEDVVEAWKRSPTHYANLIDPEYQEIGVAAVAGDYQGYNTTLVAQYFGTPKVAVVPTPEPEPIKEVVPQATSTEVIKTETTSNESLPDSSVLASEIKNETLVPATIISPKYNFVTKESIINLEISALPAEKVEIYDNEQFAKEVFINLPKETTNLFFQEGTHKLRLKSIKGEQTSWSNEYIFTIDQTGPLMDQEMSYIAANETFDKRNIVIRVEAYFSDDTEKAEVSIASTKIPLERDYNFDNLWVGNLIVGDDQKNALFNPVTLATVQAQDKYGNVSQNDLKWDEVVPAKTSAATQYNFLKQTKPDLIKPIFDISFAYYRIILILAILVAFLNIFVKIRKQHPHIIMASIAFIAFISLLIAY